MKGEDETPQVEEKPEGLLRSKALLEPILPNGENFTLIHMRSSPQKCRKLIFTSKRDTRLDSMTTHYFILIHNKIAIVSLEIYTFESADTFTLFISKADTTGFYTGPRSLSIMEIIRAFIVSILRHYSPMRKRVRICLFAKAETQYLFLGSAKNPTKHILSDASLVKWWLKCLDGLHNELVGVEAEKCTLEIPGISDSRAIATYFPKDAKLPWSPGDIFWETSDRAEDENALAVKRIPRFPDDPKSRFLDAIVSEKRAKMVTRKQFWLELESRQEFRLGKSVGIIGVEARVKDDVVEPFWKEPALSSREMKKFKELLLSADFSSLSSTQDATEKLLTFVRSEFSVDFVGSGTTVRASKRNAPESNINTLSMGVVRKKTKRN